MRKSPLLAAENVESPLVAYRCIPKLRMAPWTTGKPLLRSWIRPCPATKRKIHGPTILTTHLLCWKNQTNLSLSARKTSMRLTQEVLHIRPGSTICRGRGSCAACPPLLMGSESMDQLDQPREPRHKFHQIPVTPGYQQSFSEVLWPNEANLAWIWAFGLEDAQVAPKLREDERYWKVLEVLNHSRWTSGLRSKQFIRGTGFRLMFQNREVPVLLDVFVRRVLEVICLAIAWIGLLSVNRWN